MAEANQSQQIFCLPDLGEGLQEAEIISWHVASGDHVVADQPLVAVETDKAVVEIPAPRSGRIGKLLAEPGNRLQVGDALVEFAQEDSVDTGTVVGEIAEQQPGSPALEPPKQHPHAIRATPAVRALASKLDIDLSLVQATGPNGSISAQDVERAAKTLAQAPAAETLRGVRRAMAERMAKAHAEVVPATVNAEADIDAWVYNGSSIMLRLIRAVTTSCKTVPALNAWFDGKTMTRRLHQKIDLGIAVNTNEGLFVPVLRDAGSRYPSDLKPALQRLKSDVENRSVPAGELRGQTITLSNFGSLAGHFANLVVVPPQVAIIGAGRISSQVVAVDDQAKIHKLLPLSISFDHRVVTGGEAAQFLAAMITDLERPE